MLKSVWYLFILCFKIKLFGFILFGKFNMEIFSFWCFKIGIVWRVVCILGLFLLYVIIIWFVICLINFVWLFVIVVFIVVIFVLKFVL